MVCGQIDSLKYARQIERPSEFWQATSMAKVVQDTIALKMVEAARSVRCSQLPHDRECNCNCTVYAAKAKDVRGARRSTTSSHRVL